MKNEELGVEELYEKKELQRLDELISNDPIMSKLKKSYDKSSVEKKVKFEKEMKKQTKDGDEVRSRQAFEKLRKFDQMKEDKAKRNIFESRTISKEEKQKRRIVDLAFTTINVRNEISRNSSNNLPFEYNLEQNYPNPFNPVTVIRYSIPDNQNVNLRIYDVLGKEVAVLVNEKKEAGGHTIEFSGINLASGVYFYKIEAGNFVQTKRMVLLK